VVDSRYFTTTDATGKFTLTGLPPGTYTLHAQFDEKAKWSTSVTISAGKTTAADFASNPSVP
jgi:major membrane immunogen (membrane-anchored lipoprotein)